MLEFSPSRRPGLQLTSPKTTHGARIRLHLHTRLARIWSSEEYTGKPEEFQAIPIIFTCLRKSWKLTLFSVILYSDGQVKRGLGHNIDVRDS